MSEPLPTPQLSVVITTEHEEESLLALVRAVAEQSDRNTSVEILVTDYSPDGREQAVTGLARTEHLPVRYYRVAGASPFEARNTGIRHARGMIIAFTDDDCMPGPGWLVAYRKAFRDERIGMAGGPDKAPSNVKPFLQALDYVLTSFAGTAGMRGSKRPGSAYYPRAWNMAVSKEAIEKTGIFDESLPGAQELELSRRMQEAGFTVAHLPDCLVEHRRDTNIVGLFRSGFRSSLGRACITRGEPTSRVFIQALPAAGLFCCVAMLAVSVLNPAVLVFPVTAMAAYAGWLLASGAHAAATIHKARMLALVPSALATQHLSHAIGYTVGVVLCSAKQPRKSDLDG